MRDVLGSGSILGYCANVHPGRSLEEIKAQLETHALCIKNRVAPDEPMGIGLWFPASVAAGLADNLHLVRELHKWMNDVGLLPYTVNGFPYGDFHTEQVKFDVYSPDWSHPERGEYTLDLVEILHELLPEGEEGSISTLPLGWDNEVPPGWADILGQVVDHLIALHDETGRVIHLDIEPEPGCEIMLTQGVFTVLTIFSLHKEDPEAFRRHMRICFDLCHQAVMFEKPCEMLRWARQSPFSIGKVQISNALRAPFKGRKNDEKAKMRRDLERFVENRYLHQTAIAAKEGHRLKAFHADLPNALRAHPRGGDEWRVHFHVPVHMAEIGSLSTTQNHITEFLRELRPEDGIRHFEVETYAWEVLPDEWMPHDLAEGIAQEIEWVKETFRFVQSSSAESASQ